ncbi:MAG: polysaccharide deacetylase family protein [Planctomycetota bacterium]
MDRIRGALASLRERVIRAYCGRLVTPDPSRRVVSFTFDDFPRSALEVGGKLLEQYAARGTYYASLSFLDAEVLPGIPGFSRDHLHQLLQNGHELGCHTARHQRAEKFSVKQFRESLAENSAWMQADFPDVPVTSFSYPFGSAPPMVRKLAGRSFRCCRGIDPGVNSQTIDLNHLFALQLYEGVTAPVTVKRHLAELMRSGGWLIFYTHDVSEQPSPYGCTPKYLENILQWVVEEKVEILPVREALDSLVAGLTGHHSH